MQFHLSDFSPKKCVKRLAPVSFKNGKNLKNLKPLQNYLPMTSSYTPGSSGRYSEPKPRLQPPNCSILSASGNSWLAGAYTVISVNMMFGLHLTVEQLNP